MLCVGNALHLAVVACHDVIFSIISSVLCIFELYMQLSVDRMCHQQCEYLLVVKQYQLPAKLKM